MTIAAKKPNDVWVLFREEAETESDGICSFYILVDAMSHYCFGQKSSRELPSPSDLADLLKSARDFAKQWPKMLIATNCDPLLEEIKAICSDLGIKVKSHPQKEVYTSIKAFVEPLKQMLRGGPKSLGPDLSDVEAEELEMFIPKTYGLCPCASGKKFKFCCQKGFKDMTFAMCAAEDGDHNEAMNFMKEVEKKIGRSAEFFCRMAIVWSFQDEGKSQEYLNEALVQNPNHPRANYIFGIIDAKRKNYDGAVNHYQKAIDNYPKDDRFHLNEALNNQGNAYYNQGKYTEAKGAWEKALLLFPTDKVTQRNLFDLIYGNPELPEELQAMSPFMKRFLEERGINVKFPG